MSGVRKAAKLIFMLTKSFTFSQYTIMINGGFFAYFPTHHFQNPLLKVEGNVENE